MNSVYRSACCALLLIMVCRGEALAATVPPNFSEALVATGLSNPTSMSFAPDGRLFVCLQGGQVRVIENGALLAAPFVNLTVDSAGERGLLGLAFDPNFSTNHYVYIYYTATTPSVHNRVSRFVANGNVAVAGSEVVILDLNNLSGATNHNGGSLHFGIDGKLFIGVGENATPSNAQMLTNLLGKILRINADGTIPSDNPFITQTTGKNQAIWALGLRNPYTFAFEPLSGRMLINDVGQDTNEEIDDGFAGRNYGWPDSEGPTSNPNHTGPIYYYPHSGGPVTGCAITGGTFYVPGATQFPASFVGTYFFADFCGGWIKYLDPGNNNTVTSFASAISSPVDLQVGPEGNLYYLARGTGSVVRIFYTGNQAPQITLQPANQTVSAGQPVTFTASASGTPVPAFQWQRNQVDIPGATSVSYTIAATAAADNGARFRAIASNVAGSATSNEAVLTVTTSARVNVAAAANGATAVGSSTHDVGFAASGAINGDRKGQGWGAGGGWNDATASAWPDWLEVDFAGAKTIDEVDVFSVQDNWSAPVEPTPTMTFTRFGVSDFTVQYWNGAQWVAVPGGIVSGNTLVWRQITFAAVTTTKIRVFITAAFDTWSRVTEVEAYSVGGGPGNAAPTVTLTKPAGGSSYEAPASIVLEADAHDSDGMIKRVDFYENGNLVGSDATSPYQFTWATSASGSHALTAVAVDNLDLATTSAAVTVTVTAAGGRTNVALAANGATAVSSSTHDAGFAASGAINGDRKGQGWGAGGGWNDGTPNSWPDWLEVDFAGAKTIDEVDVFSVQDNPYAPVEPTPTMTFTRFGVSDFTVQYWNGAQWVAVPGGIVSGNTLVWRQLTFGAVTTTKIRVLITGALDTWSRVTEVEAYQ
jgi:glucose/arabinose dehydrogenase